MMPSVELALPTAAWFIIAIAVWVAIDDFLYMRIPNATHVFLLLIFAVFVLPGLTWVETAARMGVTGAVFAVGLLLHIRGVMGAGDVKFLATSAPFISPEPAMLAAWLLVIAIAGLPVFGVHRLASLVLSENRFPSFSAPGFFPYGPAISIGLITVVVMSGMAG